jgi:hypothetical protein
LREQNNDENTVRESFQDPSIKLSTTIAVEFADHLTLCQRRRDFAAAGRSKSAARTQARRPRYRGPSCLPRFIPEEHRPTAALTGLGVTGASNERA